MTAPLEAIAARVLAEHAPWRNQIGIVKRCRCGEVMDGIKRHRAHVAAEVAAALRADGRLVEAMARALHHHDCSTDYDEFKQPCQWGNEWGNETETCYDVNLGSLARAALDAITGSES